MIKRFIKYYLQSSIFKKILLQLLVVVVIFIVETLLWGLAMEFGRRLFDCEFYDASAFGPIANYCLKDNFFITIYQFVMTIWGAFSTFFFVIFLVHTFEPIAYPIHIVFAVITHFLYKGIKKAREA